MSRRTAFLLGCAASLGLLGALAVVASGRHATPTTESNLGAPATQPSLEQLAVFDRVRLETDSVPASLLESATNMAGRPDLPDGVKNGSMILSESRRVLAHAGSLGIDAYVFPSTKGYTCYAATVAGGGCIGPFTRESPVSLSIFDPDGFGRGTPVATMGLVPNNVTDVDVDLGGGLHGAAVADNAYFFEAPTETSRIEGFVIHFEDGSTTRISLPAAVKETLGF